MNLLLCDKVRRSNATNRTFAVEVPYLYRGTVTAGGSLVSRESKRLERPADWEYRELNRGRIVLNF